MSVLISSQTVRDNRDGLRSASGLMAPQPAVAAFFTLAPSASPLSFVEWDQPGGKGGTRWTVIGVDGDHLVVVTAVSSVSWSWQDRERPMDAAVSARRVALRRISSVGLEDIEADVDRTFNVSDLWGKARWLITLDDGDAIRLNDLNNRDDEDRATEFCLSLNY